MIKYDLKTPIYDLYSQMFKRRFCRLIIATFLFSLLLCSIWSLWGLGAAIFRTLTVILPWKGTSHLTNTNYSPPTLSFVDFSNPDVSIPKQIHLTWRDDRVFLYPESNSLNEWKRLYLSRGWRVNLWTDDKTRTLIHLRYRYLWPVYKSCSQNIQRADLARLIILHSEGGVYVDLDAFPTQVGYLESLINMNVSLILAQSSYSSVLTNHFLAAKANHTFLSYALSNIYRYHEFQDALSWFPYWQVMLTTGPLFLTAVYYEYMHHPKPSQLSQKQVLLLTDDQLRDYVRHGGGRSWQGADGRRWNYLVDSGWLWIYLVFGTVVMIVVVVYTFLIFFTDRANKDNL